MMANHNHEVMHVTVGAFRGVGHPRPTLAWIGKALAGSRRRGEFELDHSSLTPEGSRDQLDVIREWFPIAFEFRVGRTPTQEELSRYGDGLLDGPERRTPATAEVHHRLQVNPQPLKTVTARAGERAGPPTLVVAIKRGHHNDTLMHRLSVHRDGCPRTPATGWDVSAADETRITELLDEADRKGVPVAISCRTCGGWTTLP